MDAEKPVETIAEYLLVRPDVAAANVFGSAAQSRMHPASDIDIAVLFSSRTATGTERFERRLELAVALEETQAGYLPPAKLTDFKKMARFRNVIVHDYACIDPEILYAILQKNIGDLRLFARAIRDGFLETRTPGETTDGRTRKGRRHTTGGKHE